MGSYFHPYVLIARYAADEDDGENVASEDIAVNGV